MYKELEKICNLYYELKKLFFTKFLQVLKTATHFYSLLQ